MTQLHAYQNRNPVSHLSPAAFSLRYLSAPMYLTLR